MLGILDPTVSTAREHIAFVPRPKNLVHSATPGARTARRILARSARPAQCASRLALTSHPERRGFRRELRTRNYGVHQ